MFRKKQRPSQPPEWLIIGLGNPGGEYDGTRHNVGFEVIKELASKHKIKVSERRFKSVFGVGELDSGLVVVLARPMTYMNLSGESASALGRHFNIKPDRMVIIYDDMDLELGRVRIKPKGGAASHNGMKSLVHSLGTQELPRIRIGIGAPELRGVDHVLSRFTPDEIPLIREAIVKAAEGCEWIVRDGMDIAMNRINPTGEA